MRVRMSLEERGYSALVVSASGNFPAAVESLLSEAAISSVHTALSVSAAQRKFAESGFDFVIVNSPLPDDPGIRFAIDVSGANGTVALLLVKTENYIESYDKVVCHGVFLMPKPVAKQTLGQALRWMISARERLRRVECKNLSLEEKMEEIRIVNRAKWLLIRERKMDEPQAHRYIEKQAMDQCITKRQVAESIINSTPFQNG